MRRKEVRDLPKHLDEVFFGNTFPHSNFREDVIECAWSNFVMERNCDRMFSRRSCTLKPDMTPPLADNPAFQPGKNLEEVFSLTTGQPGQEDQPRIPRL